ncbi:beta-lactamase [Sinorhizobium fredii USDA 205]|uniref:beta-lactamase n=2 Tax=Rhizobium fredii TaxID=380 RepID=A0A844AQM7_RHIFR|nr:class A beta-lactamase [Sinorhizobium fredii]AWM24149.1 Beta-lactamase [Sinorhizobium fredii CCBAU 25509]KSV81656.1 beta-lactamase [Sinorhizobium fredii USDA 205]MCG5476030.1 class A beta-lactamase [Sinorhizobium fredii]MQW99677.1 class A beta-lactamase [Sinorhizobium fredii]MQX13008.1 class A beta-lactamase [Sinorhizobium fredii]
MSKFITRRNVLIGTALLCPALALAGPAHAAATDDDVTELLAELEKRTGGRLGVAVLDTETNTSFGYRETERFAMCSTFKALAAACALARVDRGEEKLDRRITFGKDVLLPHSPVAEKHVGGEGMTIAELCDAAITISDNAAGNLLLESFGGPAGLTSWLRSIGDEATRLDRTEPDLNEARFGDPRDTTTPAAMIGTLGKLAFGSVLSESSRQQLIEWMVANTTGDARLRAGLPKSWRIGDKTGTSSTGAVSDIAFAGPESRGPILIAVYTGEAKLRPAELNPIFAEIGRIVAGMA